MSKAVAERLDDQHEHDADDAAPSKPGELIPYRLRPYRGESNFVAGTWLRSYESSPATRRVDRDEYYRHHARLVSALIDRSVIVIAEHAELPVLLGFAAGERDRQGCVVHYCYVKGYARRQGIGSATWNNLLDQLAPSGDVGTVRYTHARTPFTEIAGRLGWQYSFYPAFAKGWE